MNIIQIDQINSDEFSSIELREEALGALGDGQDIECFCVVVEDQVQAVEVLHSSGGVTGVAWGGNAEWLEHKYSGRDGAEQAVTDYFEGQS